MENLELYNAFRVVPDSAKKTIGAGRLKGMTDINPMWRIQSLTQKFGPCGTGWKYIIRDKHMEHGTNEEIAAFVDIDLYYKDGDSWSEAIPGTGGSKFVSKEKNGPFVSDECYKMALTDALSVACKALGMGADVYWSTGQQTKYDHTDSAPPSSAAPALDEAPQILCADCGNPIKPAKKRDGSRWLAPDIVRYCEKRFGRPLCTQCISATMRAET